MAHVEAPWPQLPSAGPWGSGWHGGGCAAAAAAWAWPAAESPTSASPCRLLTGGVLPSPSGRPFVVATAALAAAAVVPGPLREEVVAAAPGDVLELLARDGVWCFGARLVYNPATGSYTPGERDAEGVFHIEWVQGLAVALVAGLPTRVAVDASTLEAPPPASDPLSRLRALMRQQRLRRAAELWQGVAPVASDAAAPRRDAAARAGELLQRLRAQRSGGAAAASEPDHAGAAAAPPRRASPPRRPPAGRAPLVARVVATLEAQQARVTAAALQDVSALDEPPGLSPRRQLSGSARDWALEPAMVRPLRSRKGSSASRDNDLGRASGSRRSSSPRKLSSPHKPSTHRQSQSKASAGAPATRRLLLRGLLNAKRSGELQALAEEWRKAETDMVATANHLTALKERFKSVMLVAHRTGELQQISSEMASEVEQKVRDFQKLKERVFQSLLQMKRGGGLDELARSMASDEPSGDMPLAAKERALRSLLEMKRSGELERLAQEMGYTEARLADKAVQLRELAADVPDEDHCSGELQRLAGEFEEEVQTIAARIRRGLLRAHRAGELQELRGELDEMQDVVPEVVASPSPSPCRDRPPRRSPTTSAATRKLWSDMTTSSDSDVDSRLSAGGGARGGPGHVRSPSVDSDSVSETDAELGRSPSEGVHSARGQASEASISPRPSLEAWGSAAAADGGEHGPSEGSASEGGRRPAQQGSRRKKDSAGRFRFARTLLNAKRSGELQALVEEWQTARSAMVSSTSGLQALMERFKNSMLDAHRTGELHRLAGDLASEVQRSAAEFQQLKERADKSVSQMKGAGEFERFAQELDRQTPDSPKLTAKERALQSLLEMKRSGELELLAQEMGDTQAELQTKADQLREVATRMRRGLIDAKRSGDLERIAGELEQILKNKMRIIRDKALRGLLRAHRRGELQELRGELDELGDEVPSFGGGDRPPAADPAAAAPARGRAVPARRLWSEMTTSEESEMEGRGRASAAPAAAGERRRWG